MSKKQPNHLFFSFKKGQMATLVVCVWRRNQLWTDYRRQSQMRVAFFLLAENLDSENLDYGYPNLTTSSPTT